MFFGIFVHINYLSKLANKILLQILLANGAQMNLKNNDDKTAGEVTSDMAIKQLLTEKIPMEEKMTVDNNNRTKYVSHGLDGSDFVPNYLKIQSANQNLILNERSLNKDDIYQELKKIEVKQNNPCSNVPMSDTGCEVKILKIRVANGDPDFIETDLFEVDQTYQNLLVLLCLELNVPMEKVERIRKLPNTKLRRDIDVKRLHNYSELELELVK